jgi:hypothetical protein
MTIFANVVNVRSAGTNVVLEFGSFFPDADQLYPPKDHQPELRVVVSGELLGPRCRIAPVNSVRTVCRRGTSVFR